MLIMMIREENKNLNYKVSIKKKTYKLYLCQIYLFFLQNKLI